MDGFARHQHGERFIVAALENLNFGSRPEAEALEKFEEAFVFFVDADDFRLAVDTGPGSVCTDPPLLCGESGASSTD